MIIFANQFFEVGEGRFRWPIPAIDRWSLKVSSLTLLNTIMSDEQGDQMLAKTKNLFKKRTKFLRRMSECRAVVVAWWTALDISPSSYKIVLPNDAILLDSHVDVLVESRFYVSSSRKIVHRIKNVFPS